jgi:drug/metabolite transporter (DMT)-like permease
MLTFITANKLTTSANAIMLQYSAPIWAGLLGWILLREKTRWEHWGALVLVIGGMILLFRDGLVHPGAGKLSLAGDILAVVSGMLFGAHSVFLRMMKEGNTSDSLLAAHVISAVICFPFFFLYPPGLSAASALSILYMGIVQIGVASLLFSYGIKRISAVGAMLTAMIEPVLNPVWVLAVTGEKPSAHALAGGGVIIAAIAASTIIGKRRESPRREKQTTV